MITNILALPADDDGEATVIVRKGMFAIVILLGGFILWACYAPIHGAIITEGIIKIDNNRKTVQHLEGGIIKKILVHEGSVVERNQPLILLEDTTASANLNILVDQLNALRAKEARLTAEASVQDNVKYPRSLLDNISEKTKEIIKNEDALFKAKRKALNEQIALIKDQIAEAGKAIASYTKETKAIEDGIKYSSEQVNASELLLNKGFIEKTQLWSVQSALAEKRERLGQVHGQLALQRENVAELQLRIINLRNEFSKQADDELKETKKTIYEQEERLRPAKNAQDRQTINAPIAGQVINLKVSTEQGVIRPGEALLDIVPTVQDLILETKISTKDIDSVRPHQHAVIQLSAFDQRTTPMVSGEVVYISGDAIADERVSPLQYFYIAHIRVDNNSLSQAEKISISPGMPVVAYIQTKARTMLQYLVSPLVDRSRRTFKEE